MSPTILVSDWVREGIGSSTLIPGGVRIWSAVEPPIDEARSRFESRDLMLRLAKSEFT
jgi:hypothetical protein